MKNALLILIPFFIGCINPKFKHEVALKTSSLKANTPKENGDTIQVEKKGYLKIRTDLLHEKKDSILIRLLNGDLYTKIIGDKYTEPTVRIGSPIEIEAYYPEYYIVIFNAAILSDKAYVVDLNGRDFRIEHKDEITIFQNREQYIKNCILVTSKDNPIREEPSISAREKKVGNSYEDISFEVIEIKGEWAKVKCLLACEGCPNNKLIDGWLKWTDQEKIIVELFYVC